MKQVFAAFLLCLSLTTLPLSIEAQEQEQRTFTVLEPYKPLYIIPTYYQNPALDQKYKELEFQISFAGHFYNAERFDLYMAYTQHSHWQALRYSGPFRETCFQPELFISIKQPFTIFGQDLHFKTGFRHHSNGKDAATSRSWNRFFINFKHPNKSNIFSYNLRFWMRIPDPVHDENPDIEEYFGNQEATLRWNFDSFSFQIKERLSYKKKGMVEFRAWTPITDSNFNLMLYGYSGYGESISSYQYSITKWGIGIIFEV